MGIIQSCSHSFSSILNSAWYKRGGPEGLNIPECWRRRRENTNDDEGKRKGTRQEPGLRCRGRHRAELLLVQNWNEMKALPPKGAGIPSTNSSPPSASHLPEAGAGPQFAGCNIVRGRWHLWNELILDKFRKLCAPFIRSMHHLPVLQIGDGEKGFFVASQGRPAFPETVQHSCHCVGCCWVILILPPTVGKYMRCSVDVGLGFITCFGQWDVSDNMTKALKCTSPLDSLVLNSGVPPPREEHTLHDHCPFTCAPEGPYMESTWIPTPSLSHSTHRVTHWVQLRLPEPQSTHSPGSMRINAGYKPLRLRWFVKQHYCGDR